MRRIVKIGGSLLTQTNLPEKMRHWFSRQPPAENIVMVGGGQLIDAVRQLDALHRSDPAVVHWRCVDLLGTTFETLRDWFPDWPAVDTNETFRRQVDLGFSKSAPTLVNVTAFYRPQDDHPLPLDWRTTSDSIAVLLGNLSSANEVVLLKSCEVDPAWSVGQLADAGIIDEAVPMMPPSFGQLRIEKL